jgi:hypothetical protein
LELSNSPKTFYKRFYLETNALYQISKFTDSVIENSFTSILSLIELISGIDNDYKKRKAILKYIADRKILIDFRFPEAFLFLSFDYFKEKELEFVEERIPHLNKLIDAIANSETLEKFELENQKLELGLEYFKNLKQKWGSNFIGASISAIKTYREFYSQGKMENNEIEINGRTYKLDTIEKFNDFFVKEVSFNYTLTINALSTAAQKSTDLVSQDDKTLGEIFESYNHSLNVYVDNFSKFCLYSFVEKKYPAKNDFLDLAHLMYLENNYRLSIVSDDKIFQKLNVNNTSTNELIIIQQMPNYLDQLFNPSLNIDFFFRVMADRNLGGLNSQNISSFMEAVNSLPAIGARTISDLEVFLPFNLFHISEEQGTFIVRRMHEISIERSKKCWHPQASPSTCNVDNNGRTIISDAHSIQNNRILNSLAENGHVSTYSRDSGDFEGILVSRNRASTFLGFCNTHDHIFVPIENSDYEGTAAQNFLFAYRAFVVASHKKIVTSHYINYGEQATNDIAAEKFIFDNAILNGDFSVIETDKIELENYYPIAASTSFPLEFDFMSQGILHSDERMENLFITLFPQRRKTILLISYFSQDRELYARIAPQILQRNNLKSDISILVAAHTEDIYFNPTYYRTFIDPIRAQLENLFNQTQLDYIYHDENGNETQRNSLTPPNYLANNSSLSIFGY